MRTLVDTAKETLIQLALSQDRWTGTRRGQAPLWEKINSVYEHWRDLGHPSQNAYHVDWDQQRHLFRLLLSQNPIGDL